MTKLLDTVTVPMAPSSLTARYEKRLMVTAGRTSRELGGRIAEKLGVALTDAGLKTFADGEVYCRYEESIRGADLFIVQSICGWERENLTVNDALWELLLMVHAAKHASAHRIVAVTPWYGYSRQDKKSAPREPISARLVADVLETAGIDRLVTMDLHAGQLQGFFSKPVDHMTAMPILTQFVQDRLGDKDLVIIAPDAGRVKLVRKFAQKVGAPYALMEKERPAQQVAEIGYVIGDVKGKTATHGLFSGQAFEILSEGPLSGIVVTDTVPLRDGAPSMITQLTCADVLEDSIRRIFTDDSVSEIFAGENQLF
jgi:ribose-phosphate pyrophosphokinase